MLCLKTSILNDIYIVKTYSILQCVKAKQNPIIIGPVTYNM